MIGRLKQLAGPVAILGILLGGCEPGTITAPQGEVRGVVLVEGMSLQGVIVELTGPQVRSMTTDAAGRYSFDEVPAGAYVVSVRSVPDDASFPATSRTAVVSGAQAVTVDFLGNFIRTASIEGSVTSGSQGLSGVTVTLEGAQSGTTLSGLGGSFVFSGLRAGHYQVEISGLPDLVTFPSLRTEVELSTGQTFLVTFEGVPELTASVVIRSIIHRLPHGTTELADPQNLRGELEVTVTVDMGEDTLLSVELLLGDDGVGRQIFDGGAGAPTDASLSPQPAAPLDIIFPVKTAEFEDTTGAVRFPNGQVLLTARLATAEGGPSAWLSSVQVQLRNLNTFTGRLEPGRGPVLGDGGEEWVGGDLTLSVIPVLFDASRPVGTVTVDLRRMGGSQLRSKTQAGTAPFSISLAEDGVPGADNVAGYQTPPAATDQLRVLSALYADGGSVPGVPVVLASELRIDNVGPPPAVFALPRQAEDEVCCLGNWVGAAFPFHEALELQPDAGVGGVTATIHAGDSGLTNPELAELPAVLIGGDLDPTTDNSALRAVAVTWDALRNRTASSLAPSEGNSLSNQLGAVFGIDLGPPQSSFDLASVPDQAKNPGPGSAWVLAVSDAAAGVDPMGARTTVRLSNPAVAGTSAECLFPGTQECDPGRDGLLRIVPDGVEGYLTLVSYVLDRAGNVSNTVTSSVLTDLTPPNIPSVQLPGTLIPNGQTIVSAVVSDNLDLHQGWIALEFGDVGAGGPEVVPPQAAEILGVPFDDALATGASIVQTFSLLIGLERVLGALDVDAPSGAMLPLTGARAVATDAAGNLATLSEPLPGAVGFATRSFSVVERGDVGGVADWALRADTNRVCRSDSQEGCSAGAAPSVELVVTARGLGGSFEQPFDRVYFYLLRGGEAEWIGVTSVTEVMDGVGPLAREWSWTLDWTPSSAVPFGPISLVAVGVDGGGNALRTLDLTSVTVEGGP